MQVIDLTEDYIRYVVQQNDPKSYECTFPHLFEHYYAFYAQPQVYSFRNTSVILRRRTLILEHLPTLAERFERKDLHISDIDIVLFVGHGTSNGHAFYAINRWIVWLPVETYHSIQAIQVFVSHEIAHALHYQHQPDFYFSNHRERFQVFRLLATEGIATLTSKEILGIEDEQALWADYLPYERTRRWYEQCLKQQQDLFQIIADRLEESDEQIGLFSFSGADDCMKNRAGYYAGLVLIERHMKQHKLSIRDLFAISKQEFWQIIQSSLESKPA
ncbi:MAG: DUF2268 domain-containing putative Zn-dependent protease [Anaerolineales bacterium]